MIESQPEIEAAISISIPSAGIDFDRVSNRGCLV